MRLFLTIAKQAAARTASTLMSGPLRLAFLVYGIGVAILVFGEGLSEPVRALVANAWYLPIGAASAVIAWRVSASPGLPPRQRAAWRLIVLASATTFIADALWTFVENIQGQNPANSLLANFGYLVYYPLMLASLMLFPQALRSRKDALKFGLDVATVVVTGGMAVWQFIISPLLISHDASRVAFVLALAYPVGDMLILLGVATVLMRCPRGPRRVPLMVLAASVVAAIVGDTVWAQLSLSGSFQAGQMQDVPYIIQYVLFAVSVTAERRRLVRGAETEDPSSSSERMTALPYAAVFIGYALLISVTWEHLTIELLPLVLGAVILTVLVIARQIIAVSENVRLGRERAVLIGERRFKSLIQHASDVVSIIDDKGRMLFASPSMEPTFGYSTLAMVGDSVLKVIHPDDLPDVKRSLKFVMSNPDQIVTARWRMRRSDGEWAQTDNTLTNLLSDENIRGLVLTTRDVSARVSLEARLTHEAFHDPLTGLANRVLFHNLAEEALARPRAETGIVAVLFIDLDEFKDINDSYGHGFGDSLLKAAAQRLVSGLRPEDTAARLGGDEFAVLCNDPQGKVDANALANRLALLFHSPFSVEGRQVAVTASVGVAVALRDETTEELLRNADLAMYVAKSRGRRQAARFEPAMHSTLVEKVGLHADLCNAMANGELEMVYQPIHSLKTRELIGAEALMRWNHPKRGSIDPSIFIPSAEESGLIVPIGRWSLNQVCRDAEVWRREDPSMRSLLLSVNVSGRQIRELTLVDDVKQALRTSGHDPSLLMLELTESMLLEDTESSVATMQRLKTAGVLLAIDDFGTGYSSLSYLQHLPIDLLKIDRAFVEHIELDRSSVAVARAIIALATTMSLRTVAEGIETARQAELLLGLDCEFGQGFFYGKPMSCAEFIAYARRCSWNAAA